MNYWIIKSEPIKYSWDKLKEDGQTIWDGVRNYQARNNLKSMKIGDLCMFYHSNEDMAIIGIARVIRECYQDPSTDDERWVSVDVEPLEQLKKPVTLALMKQTPELANIGLIRQGRLSVMPVNSNEFDKILELSEI